MNMSYCRFYNTSMDVSDCLEALRNGETLSKGEARKAKDMFKDIVDYLYDEGCLDIEISDTNEAIDELIDGLTKEE